MTQPLAHQPNDPGARTRTVDPATWAACMRTRTVAHNLHWIRATTPGLTLDDRAILVEAARRLSAIGRDNILFGLTGSGWTLFILWLAGVL